MAADMAMSIEYPCPVCHAKPNQDCVNTITPGQPLPGRKEHYARALPPDYVQRKTRKGDG